MQAVWLAFLHAGRPEHPELKVIFAMLAGLAPLHAERLVARGGPSRLSPTRTVHDRLVFYDTSSYGPDAIGALSTAIGGPRQLLYGSDRPVVEPGLLHEPGALHWELLADASARVFGAAAPGGGVVRPLGLAPEDRLQAPAAVASAQTQNVPVAREEALR